MRQQLLEQEVKHLNKLLEAARLNNIKLSGERNGYRVAWIDAIKELGEVKEQLSELRHRMDILSK